MNSSSPHPDSLFWLRALLIAAVLVRLAAVPFVHRSGYLSDELEYMQMAERLSDGGEFVDSNGYRSVRAPLFPMLLAVVFLLSGGSIALAHVVICLLGTYTVYLAYRIAVHLWGETRTGLIAAGLVAFHPSLVLYSTLLLSETLYTVLFLAALLGALGFMAGPSVRTAATLGALAGFASLARPVFLGFFPLLLILVRVQGGRRLNRGCAAAFTVWVLLLLPWAVRNYALQGELVPVSSGAGNSLLTGNNPYATGTWRVAPGFEEWFNAQARSLGVRMPDSLTEADRNRVSGRIAIRYIVAEPGKVLALALKKAHIFLVYPITNSDSDHLVQTAAVGADFILLLAFVIGVVAAGERRYILIVPLSAILFFMSVQVVLHSEARFRLPVLPLICTIGAYGIRVLMTGPLRRRLLAARSSRLAVWLGMAAVVAIYGWTAWMTLVGNL